MARRGEFYAALFVLHERLVSGDPSSLGEVAKMVLEPLTKQLRQKFPGSSFPQVDDHLLMEKAADALLEYGSAPNQANATSGAGVLGFLTLRATSRVKNALRRERARQRTEGRYAHGLGPTVRGEPKNPVELRLVRGEYGEEPPEERVPAPVAKDLAEVLEGRDRRADVLQGVGNELDRRILQMMLDGIRSTAAYSEVVGITELPVEEQRRIVKQHKDRIKAAASRRQEAKRTGPRRRGRPPRRPEGP
jgi:hypothetical protein